MHAIARKILIDASDAGTEAAFIEYDALTPETARALLKRGSDIVPDYAGEAGEYIAACAFNRTVDFAHVCRDDVRNRAPRLAHAATEAWARAFRNAWPAEDAARLAAQVDER